MPKPDFSKQEAGKAAALDGVVDTGREEGIAVVADKIVKALLIPHYPPLSCSAGRCHVVSNNCTCPHSSHQVAAVRLRGEHERTLMWLLQGSSIPEMLQVLGKLSLSMLLPLEKTSETSLSHTPVTWQ